jgi:phage gp36-like protein
MAYLTIAQLKTRTLAPAAYVDAVEAAEPGWTAQALDTTSAWIDSRLRKRYAAPFSAPYPETVCGWVEAIVTERLYLKRGIDATDQQLERIQALADRARDEVKEAADSKEGLFDLPLRADTTEDGISKGTPLGYGEASPYTWADNQRADADYDPIR